MRITLSKSFVTVSDVTDRTRQVAEAFGLGLDTRREFPVLANVEVDLRPGDICFIVGASGGGKSTLLRMLGEEVQRAGIFGPVRHSGDIQIPEDEILIHGAGQSFEAALRNLSLTGLNDAFVLIRRVAELSDGQRYRFRLAKLLASNARVWVVDEFLSTLDRDTAKAVAYCVQKVARRERRTLIAATTHADLVADLNPSILVRKGFGAEAHVEYRTPTPASEHRCSLTHDITIAPGSPADYHVLEAFHYRATLPLATRFIYVMRHHDRVIGAIAYANSPLQAKGRNLYLGYAPSPDEVNRDFLTISRVVLHPTYRALGLGARLVRETLARVERKYVETMAVMARFNPFFAKAGMTRVNGVSDTNACRAMLEEVLARGVDPRRGGDFVEELQRLDEERYAPLVAFVASHTPYFVLAGVYGHRQPLDRAKVVEDLRNRDVMARVLTELAIQAQEKAYYIWRNPAL